MTQQLAADSSFDDIARTYDARELIPTGSLAQIELDDKTYFLRITRAGKLILTK